MNDFQERFLELLNESNLSRLQLSKLIGVSSTTLNGYFNNDFYPQIDIAIKIAQYFKCSLDYLFGLSDFKSIKYKISLKDMTNNFTANLDVLIKENNTSIAKTMKELNMSEYNYYRWKSGKFPKTINLISVAKHFDISIDFLLGNK